MRHAGALQGFLVTLAAVATACGSNPKVVPGDAGTVDADVTDAGAGDASAVDAAPDVVDAVQVALVEIQVTPPNPSIPVSTIRQLTATGVFSNSTARDITSEVTWASSVPAVAQVSNADGSRGSATGRALGTTSITASLAGVTGATTLTVTAAVLESIAVTPAVPSIPVGRTQAFTATGTFSDASVLDITGQVTWRSSAPDIADISNVASDRGVASAFAVGTTGITAALAGITGSATLTVTEAVVASIAVTPADFAVPAGRTLQFTARGTFSDGTVRNITSQANWASSESAIATISSANGSRGLATGVAIGTTTITATLAGVTGTTTLAVIATVVASIAVTPAHRAVVRDSPLQLTAMATFSDGTVRDITSEASWASSNSTAVSVSNVAGSRGLASGHSSGTPNITATLGGVTGTTTLTMIELHQTFFSYSRCRTPQDLPGHEIFGTESIDSARFSSVRWTDAAGTSLAPDMPVLSGGFFGSSCVPRSLIADGQELRVVFISANDTFTARFTVMPVGQITPISELGGELLP